MNAIDILYLVTSMASLASGIPQVKQLFKEKRSDELSLSTWTMWFLCQITFLIYIAVHGDTLMLATNTIWLVFYAAMLWMVVYYRRHPGPLLAEDQNVTETISE
ncbi:MAG: PQ-loop repeat-containing protein [Candidatus Saccharimonas sp.]